MAHRRAHTSAKAADVTKTNARLHESPTRSTAVPTRNPNPNPNNPTLTLK